MYEYIKGTLAHTGDGYAVIDVGGIGYKIITSNNNLNIASGQNVTFYTYLHVKEDIFELYGFATPEERASFLLLLSVSGVGPKAAISILSCLTPANLATAIITNTPKAITAAQGVGPKVASRIILELKDKIGTTEMITSGNEQTSSPQSAENEAIVALTSLGYSFNDAAAAVAKAPKDLSVEDTIKFALKQFI